MKSKNRVNLLGNVGKISGNFPATEDKPAMVSFTLATNERPGKDGKERVEWHSLVAYGKTAEILAKYAGTGKQLDIEGSLRTTKDGERYFTKIVVHNVILLGGKGDAKAAPKVDFSEVEPMDDETNPF